MKRLSTLFFVLTVSCLGLSGCGQPRPQTDPALDQAAWQTAAVLRSMNHEIHTSKGIAKLRLASSSGVQHFQIAWAAEAPNRVRISFTASGYPVETIVADGEKVTFFSHTGRHRPHTTTSSDPDLAPYTQVPLKLSDLIRLLLGQLPIQDFHDAWFMPDDPSRLRIHKKFSSHSQELLLGTDQPIQMLRRVDRNDEIRYEIHFHAFSVMDTKRIAADLTITDGKSQSARITITQFWPDTPLKESVFQLTPGRT